ncbi:helix-turn-helix transcriptional regulator [Nonomuraea sp. NPDC026600]|uniref:PadR family transcriptional regulator n=1 Tax=Nonomuraea sp. NPDC026600 TaxID=3155363 RepID=UPI0033CFFC0F
MGTPRMTLQTQLVLRALLVDATREMYGLEICAAAGLQAGTIHPILARFEGIGWLESRWEDLDPHEAKRPRRRYYRLTPDGLEQARGALAEAAAKAPQLSLLPQRPITGGAT